MNSLKYTLFFGFSLIVYCTNAQDSLNMSRVGQWNPAGMVSSGSVTYNDIWGYTTPTGEEYAIIGNVDSILIVDITDCANPVRVYGFDGGNTTTWRDIKTFGTYVYSVCDNCTEGLHIFDMSALPSGTVQHALTTTAFFDEAHNIYIDSTKSKLYATGSDSAVEGVVILDLSTPANPTLIDNIHFDEEIGNPGAFFYIHDIYVKNDTAYASHGNKGYYIWDLSNLNDIQLLGDFDSPGYNHSSWINDAGTYAYYAEEIPLGQPMAVVDLANLGSVINNIQVVNTFKDPIGTGTNVTPHNPFVKNDTMYISYYEDGIKVYDLSNPVSPTLIGYYDTYPDNGATYTGYNGAWGTYPFFDSGCICVSDIKYGLNILRNCTTSTFFQDADMDGYGNSNATMEECEQPIGYVLIGGDCDDNDPNNFPGNAEFCDNADNDCDNLVDETSDITYYRDEDGDLFGNPTEPTNGCIPLNGYADNALDCDDGDSNINPEAPELCDGLDNNCDGNIDEGLPTNDYFLDADNDGFGDPNGIFSTCGSQPTGYVTNDTDCDDMDANINPMATELCDGLDNNCNGLVDEGLVTMTYYEDADNDTYGNIGSSINACSQPLGYVIDSSDCDDTNASINPIATEICDGLDNNCDGNIDEGCSNNLAPCDDHNLTINAISQSIYRAKQNISSPATISSTENITYHAGTDIDLNPNFEVALGAEFLANIADCNASNLIVSNGPAGIKTLTKFLNSKSSTTATEFILYKEANNTLTKIGVGTKSYLLDLMNQDVESSFLIIGIRK